MLWNIFLYELRYWFKQPATYIFGAIFLILGMSVMAISGDILGEMNIIDSRKIFANSSFRLISYYYDLNLLILFVIPVFVGGSIYRDYSSNAFMVLYSYPILKLDYFFAKFLSGLSISLLILSLIGIGLFLGSLLPGLNPLIIVDNTITNYLQPYLLVVFPNLIFVSMIVFSIVILSRNSYSGFIVILLIYVLRRVILFVLGGPENELMINLFDPFGQASVFAAVGNWSFQEINSSTIHLSSIHFFNRIIWIGVSIIFFLFAYQKFHLTQQLDSFKFKLKAIKTPKSQEVDNTSFVRTSLSEVASSYSLLNQLLATWKISNYEFASIIRSKSFLSLLIGSSVFMILILGQVNPQYTFRIHPLTQVMLLIPALFYSFVVMIITFLYAGILVHRDRRSMMDQLVDVSPIPNWSLLGSKLITLLKIQVLLLSIIMIVGISIQTLKAYYHFELTLYLFHIYVILFVTLAIWAMLSLFIQTFVNNHFLGLFFLIMFAIGLSGLDGVGIKLDIFKFNSAPIIEYSDLSGYGDTLAPYFIHKLYWGLFGFLLLIGTYLFWERGISQSFKIRLQIARDRITIKLALVGSILLIGIISTGTFISKKVYPPKSLMSIEVLNQYKAEAEHRYATLKNIVQPRLSKVMMEMHLFPKERSYTSNGTLFFVNKSTFSIDTLLVNYPSELAISYSLNREVAIIIKDSILHFDINILENTLFPDDTLKLSFEAFTPSSTPFRNNSEVSSNGTFLLADLPLLGYPDFEFSNHGNRNSYDLPHQDNSIIQPTDINASQNSYVGKNIDLFDFETIVSTSSEEIALAPGKLITQWNTADRNYYQYKSQSKIRNGIVFNSGVFDVSKDSLNGISLEIYHHKTHIFNIDRMMRALKATLKYSAAHFGDYPFEQMRIIEFPKTYGRFAQSFANTIPFSELAGFTSKEDDSENRFDDVFRLTAHEMAHQWWGHQIIPAEALGSRMLTESLSEYTAMKVFEQEYGIDKRQLYLELIRKNYLNQRRGVENESPLSLVEPNDGYIHYAKGLMVFNSLNQYLGDETFNKALKSFFHEFSTTKAPYPTSLDLINTFKKVTPDSLHYLLVDMFEEVTLYDNSIIKAEAVNRENNSFDVKINFNISKFRDMEISNPLPLNDWIEIAIFGEYDILIHSKKYLISTLENELTIPVMQKPFKVLIDPYSLLIEENISDNEYRF